MPHADEPPVRSYDAARSSGTARGPDGGFTRKAVIAVGLGIGAIALALFLWYAMYVLLLAFAGVLAAVALRGMAVWVAGKTGLAVRWSLGVVLLLWVVGLVATVWLLAPSVARQIDDFTEKLPQTVSSLEDRLATYQWGRDLLGRTTPPGVSQPPAPEGSAASPPGDSAADGAGGAGTGATTPPSPAQAAATAPPSPSGRGDTNAAPASTAPASQPASQPAAKPGGGAGQMLAGAVQGPTLIRTVTRYASLLIQAAVAVLVVLVVGIYLAASPDVYERGVLRLLPESRRPRVAAVLAEVADTLRHWLVAQLIPMAIVGVIIGGGLWLLGIRLWLTLGLLAALFNFIPNFGPLISLLPAVLFALAESPDKVPWVIALSLAAQTLEGYVITPLVQNEAVKLPPALTILVQVLMGLLMGGIGVVLAAPLAAAGMVIAKRLYVEDALGDDQSKAELQHAVDTTPKTG